MDNIVSVEAVKRTYGSGAGLVHALNGLSLNIAPGEFTALMGPSGSGKTTLLNIIGALDQPTSGSVTVDGKCLDHLNASELSVLRRDRIGFVFQSYNLIPVLTAFENTEFVLMLQGVDAKARKERAYETLKAVGLSGMEGRLPDQLSGGQQQRVAVARAIVGRPALVLADEPTANLDSKTGHALVELMATLNQDLGLSFVFATHDPIVMAAARRVIRLVDGVVDNDERR